MHQRSFTRLRIAFLRLALLYALALPLISVSAHAAIAPAWVTTYQAGQSYDPRALAADSVGNTYIVATIEITDDDMAITKFDPAGDFAWQQIVGGAGGGDDLAVDVVLDAAESAVYAIARGVPDTGGTATLIYKLDAATGETIWETFFRVAGSVTESPQAAAATPDGGLVFTGGTWRGDNRLDFLTVRLDADGDVLWQHLHDDGGAMFANDDRGDEVAVQADGDVVVTGTSSPPLGGTDILTFCFDGATGAVKWQARYSTNADETAWDLTIAPDGDAVVLGADPGGVDLRWIVVRYDADDGREIWQRLVDPGFDDFPRAVATDAAGDVYATGRTDPDGDDGNGNDNLIALALEGTDGSLRWLAEVGGEERGEGDHGNALRVLGDRLFVAGYTSSSSFVGMALGTQALLLELATADGAVLDSSTIDTSEPSNPINDRFSFLASDASGRLYAAGRTYDDPDPADGKLELVAFTRPFFTDGFESGDTSSWEASH